jgi:hypothetical protein
LNFASHLQTTALEQEQLEFCKSIDAYVLEAFRGQNFMRGFTPRAVEKALSEAKKLPLLDSFMSHWRLDPKECGNCADIGTLYTRVVKPGPAWREWLLDFSTSTHHSDALLIPILDFAREDKENDRGLLLSKRSMGVVILLIDTQNGNLIWTSQRQSTLSTHRLREGAGVSFPDFPEWKLITRELLIDTLWREYPGRIFI